MADKEFGNRLKQLRLNAGYTQKQVYEHFDIPQSTFSSWEVGKSEPSGAMLFKLCEFYRCDMLKELSSDEGNITFNELKIIEKYRGLDPHGKEMVDFTLQKEWERSTSSNNENKLIHIPSSNADHLVSDAAHKRTDIEIPENADTSDNDIMNDDSRWKTE